MVKDRTTEIKIENLTIACANLMMVILSLTPEYNDKIEIIANVKEQLRADLEKTWKEYREE